MKSRGLASHRGRKLGSLLRGRCRADQHPVAARFVDRLDDEFVEVGQDVAQMAVQQGRNVSTFGKIASCLR